MRYYSRGQLVVVESPPRPALADWLRTEIEHSIRITRHNTNASVAEIAAAYARLGALQEVQDRLERP